MIDSEGRQIKPFDKVLFNSSIKLGPGIVYGIFPEVNRVIVMFNEYESGEDSIESKKARARLYPQDIKVIVQ